MPNPGNLRPPWKPGESRNPKGRPPGPSLLTLVTNALAEEITHKHSRKRYMKAEAIVRIAIARALAGDFRFSSLTVEGLTRVPQRA